LVAGFYNELQIFDMQDAQTYEFLPKSFSQKFDSELKLKKGVNFGDE
jgi:hypothetical protein